MALIFFSLLTFCLFHSNIYFFFQVYFLWYHFWQYLQLLHVMFMSTITSINGSWVTWILSGMFWISMVTLGLIAFWTISSSFSLLNWYLLSPSPPNSGKYQVGKYRTDCFSVTGLLMMATCWTAMDTSFPPYNDFWWIHLRTPAPKVIYWWV